MADNEKEIFLIRSHSCEREDASIKPFVCQLVKLIQIIIIFHESTIVRMSVCMKRWITILNARSMGNDKNELESPT